MTSLQVLAYETRIIISTLKIVRSKLSEAMVESTIGGQSLEQT